MEDVGTVGRTTLLHTRQLAHLSHRTLADTVVVQSCVGQDPRLFGHRVVLADAREKGKHIIHINIMIIRTYQEWGLVR